MIQLVPAAVIALISLLIPMSIHKVNEGHVGVYYRGGALIDKYTEAGYNAMIPFITTMHEVQITIQTDEVTNIPCGTRGGVLIYFDKVEVVNRLAKDHVVDTVRNYGVNYDKIWIFDKIHHEINQFCSQHSLQDVYIEKFDTVDDRIKEALQSDCSSFDTGIQIIGVRVTKPKIPEVIRRNYEEMEAQKTQFLIAVEHQKVVEKEAETERRRSKIEAEKAAEVAYIKKQQQIMEEIAIQNISRIQDEMHLAKERALSDANSYRMKSLAESNAALLTPQYLEMIKYQAVANSTKIYFGPSIPGIWHGALMEDAKRK